MRHFRYGVLLAAIAAPLLLAVCTTLAAIGTLWNGRIALGMAAMMVAVLSAMFWLLIVAAWRLALKG